MEPGTVQKAIPGVDSVVARHDLLEHVESHALHGRLPLRKEGAAPARTAHGKGFETTPTTTRLVSALFLPGKRPPP